MQTRWFIFWAAFFFLPLSLTAEETVVHPVDNGTVLRNPGMGWVFHHFDNSLNGYGEPLGQGYDGREFPGMSTVYLRLAWSHLEPKEGEFAWSVLDSIIQRYARAGMKFALRLTAFEGDPKQGPPQWLRDAQCPGYIVNPYNVECWEPDYSSPLFLEKLARFLNAAGERYAGHPDLAFVDVGTIGIWGEGNPIFKKYPISVLKTHIDLHRHAFPTVLLVANDDWAGTFRNPDDPKSRGLPAYQDDASITRFVYDQGLTLRDDSLNVYADPKLHYSTHRAELFWRTRPVILEMGHYGYAKKVGAWGGERYLQAVEDYHGSYTSIHADPIVFLKENAELIAKINARLGYRLQLVEAAWSTKAQKSEALTIRSTWNNAGVAYCYSGGHPIWTLLDSQGNIGAVFADETFDAARLKPSSDGASGEKLSHSRSFPLPPTLRSGEYTLCVSMGDLTGKPKMALPYPSFAESGDDARRYPLGKINVE